MPWTPFSHKCQGYFVLAILMTMTVLRSALALGGHIRQLDPQFSQNTQAYCASLLPQKELGSDKLLPFFFPFQFLINTNNSKHAHTHTKKQRSWWCAFQLSIVLVMCFRYATWPCSRPIELAFLQTCFRHCLTQRRFYSLNIMMHCSVPLHFLVEQFLQVILLLKV